MSREKEVRVEVQTIEFPKAVESFEEMQRFKELLFELSTRFISLSSSEIDSEIEKGLERIGKFCGFDRITLLTDLLDKQRRGNSYSYIAPGFKPSPLVTDSSKIPWLMENLLQGKTITLANIPDELPNEAKEDKIYCIAENIRSVLALPFNIGGTAQGALIFTSFSKEHGWSDNLIRELHCLGEILTNALERKRATDVINELRQFENLLSEISATYINLPSNEIDRLIRHDLGRLGTFMKVDRCILYLISEDKSYFKFNWYFGWWPDEDNDYCMENIAWMERDSIFDNNFQYVFDKWRKGETIQLTRIDDFPEEARKVKEIYNKYGLKSYLSIPISVSGETLGALVFTTTRAYRTWPENLIPRLRLFGEVFINALNRKKSEETVQNALADIKRLNKQIEADYIYLKEEISQTHNFDQIIGKSASLKSVFSRMEQVALTNTTVLIMGETGTGKELIARGIHSASRRANRPLVKVDCAALTPSLIESELFGHEKGAFTGAGSRKIGRFEFANGGTLFLDEIGEFPLSLQSKLLRVLQDHELERVGGTSTVHIDVRIIAATNRDIQREVEEGRFRRDLWYRLNVFPIILAPLRERTEDIPFLVDWFVKKYGNKVGKQFGRVSKETIQALKYYSWPGNIRELENTIEKAVIISQDGVLHIEIPSNSENPSPLDKAKTLKEVERNYILDILGDTDWKIQGPQGAARRLGLDPGTLRSRMKKLHISRNAFQKGSLPG